MMNYAKKLQIGQFYKVREEKNFALLFSRKELGILKISKELFKIFKEIDKNSLSLNEIITKFKVKNEDKEKFCAFFEHLFKTGVVEYFKGKYNFKQIFNLKDKELKFQAPNFVWWDITSVCNLKCYYCYSSSGKPSEDELTTSEIKKIIKDLASSGVFFIYFLGGEPFMKKDFIDILKYCDEVGIGTMVTTNGTLINEAIAKKIKKYNVTNVRVSIDSHKEKTNNKIRGREFAFSKAMEGFKALSKHKPFQFGISTTLGPDNYKHINDVVKLAKEYGCDHIQLTPISATGRAVESGIFLNDKQMKYVQNKLRKLRQKEKDILIDAPEGVVYKDTQRQVYIDKTVKPDIMGCNAGRTCIAIQNNGNLGYCLLERTVVGNIKNQSLMENWKEINKKILAKERIMCKNCKNKDVCEGPCMSLDNKCSCDLNNVIEENLKEEC